MVASALPSLGTAGESNEKTGSPADLPQTTFEALRADVDALRRAVEQSDHEIDHLQMQAAEAALPWYRNIQTMVAVFALILSVVTAVVSGYTSYTAGQAADRRLRQQELQDAKTTLRSLFQQMAELERRDLESKRGGDALLSASLGASFGSEMLLLLDQALVIVEAYPGEITSAEYVSLGSRLLTMGQVERAEPLMLRAVDTARSNVDAANALRQYGYTLYLEGKVADGRRQYEAALSVWTRFPTASHDVRAFSNWTTEMAWAGAEMMVGNCDEAEGHMRRGKDHLDELTGPGWDVQRQQYAAMVPQVRRCVPQEPAEG
jgi:tetratricopeptide (TPR) repeat protein